MKKLTLFSIILSLFALDLTGQQTGRLDSTLTYRTFSPDHSWDQLYRTIYLPDVPEGISLLQHDRKELKAAIPDWTRLCDDSIASRPNLTVHYTIPVIFGRTEYVTYEKEQKTLNPDGSIHRHETFRGADDGVSWTPNQKIEYTYHSDGSKASESIYYWDFVNEVLVLRERKSYTYNQDGLVTEEIIENQNNFSREFGYSEMFRYFYNEDEQVIKEEHYRYDYDNLSWNKAAVTDYSYHSNGKLSVETTTKSPLNNPWIADSSLYYYDSQDRIVLYLEKNSFSGEMKEAIKKEFSYENDGLTVTEKLFWKNDGIWEERKREEKTWNNHGDLVIRDVHDTNSPDDSFREEYYFSYKNTSTDEVLEEICTLPNPLSVHAALNCPKLSETESYEVSFFDYQGKLVRQFKARKGERLRDLLGMKQGMYILQIANRKAPILRQKVMIQE